MRGRPPRLGFWIATILTLAFSLMLGVLLPGSQVRAGEEGGGTSPPAVSVVVSINGSGPDGDFSSHVAGVVNATGENDLYIDEATGRPHKSMFQVSIPSTGTVFSEVTYTSPLQQAEPITPPPGLGTSS